tara:strand:+ start:393 stop:836 length:444 start_codon:yes stop_codon:yes gene_type:complete
MEKISCAVGITLLLSSVIMSVLNLKKDKFNNFIELLNPEQKKIYQENIIERVTIYHVGMVLGIIAGYLYYVYNKKDKYLFCKVIAIMSLVKIGFYYLYPKKPYLVNYLTDQDQVKAWTDIYTTMEGRWKQSIILGFIGYLFISYSMK